MATVDWSKKTSDVPEGARRQWRADRSCARRCARPGGLHSDGVQFLPNQLDDTSRAIVPAGGPIGTRGQESSASSTPSQST